MTDPTDPPAYLPQPYPLWCAERADDGQSISVGRVIAWTAPRPQDADDAADQAVYLVPVVAAQDGDGRLGKTGPSPIRWQRFLADSRNEALRLAEQARDVDQTTEA